MTEQRKAMNDLLKSWKSVTYKEAQEKIPGLKYHTFTQARHAIGIKGHPTRQMAVEHTKEGIELGITINQPTKIKLTNGHAIGTLRITPEGISYSPANAKKASTGEIEWSLLQALSGISKS